MASEREERTSSARLVPGLTILTLGLLLTAHNFDYIDAHRYLSFWPVVIIALGVARVVDHPRRSGGYVVSLIGAALLLHTLDHLNVFRLWPLVLVLLGLSLLVRARRGPAACCTGEQRGGSGAAVLGGANHRVTSDDFRGGDYVAILGGYELDLRDAAIRDEARIDVLVLWGGIEIRVPENWQVVNQVTALLAGVSDETRSPGEGPPGPRLVLDGLVLMGGVEVRN